MGDIQLNVEEAKDLADKLFPHLLERLITSPTYWGDRNRVHVGNHVSLVNTLFNAVSGEIYVDDFVFFGHNVCVLTGTHEIDKFDLSRQTAIPELGRDIHIERGAWISSNSTILGPCRIGRDAVIGAGSVVICDVRAGWFYAGVPARPIKPVASEYDHPEVENDVATL